MITNHLFSCLWVWLGRWELKWGIDNWLSQKSYDDLKWQSIYLRAFYFNMVTMVTVGYGDIAVSYFPHPTPLHSTPNPGRIK